MKRNTARYVDGYVLPVPKRNLRVYRGIAQKAGAVWKDHGALEYRECAGEDLDVKWGVPFPGSSKAQARRNRGLRLDRVQIAQPSRLGECKGDEGSAHE